MDRRQEKEKIFTTGKVGTVFRILIKGVCSGKLNHFHPELSILI
jgi:hypothetical protein